VETADAMRLAAELGLDVHDLPICLACLSVVTMAIDEGEGRAIAAAVRRMTPDLWAEGLEQPVRTALRRARDREVAGAEAALLDVNARGARSAVAKATVRVLAEQQSERAGGDLLKMGWRPWPPPELC
jgi:hypothetical protein